MPNLSVIKLQISPDLPVQQKKSGRLYIWMVVCSLLYAETLKTRTNMSRTRPPFSREETDDTDNTDDTVVTDDTDNTNDTDVL